MRRFIIKCFRIKSFFRKKVFDFEEVIEFGDLLLESLDRRVGEYIHEFPLPDKKGVWVHDLYFPSPLIVSSFKDNPVALEVWLKMGMGGFIFKTILENSQEGNPRPRIVDFDQKGEILNAMGLPGKGLEGLRNIICSNQALLGFERPVGISVGGKTKEEYCRNFLFMNKLCDNFPKTAFFFELNISCPNIDEGKSLTENHESFKETLLFLRKHTSRVVGVKLSPDQSNEDIVRYIETISELDKTYVNLGNTTYRDRKKMGLSSEDFFPKGGGLSGDSLFPRTLEMLQLAKPFNVPVLSTGGVSKLEQAESLLQEGASLVGIATALVKDPYRVIQMNLEVLNSKETD